MRYHFTQRVVERVRKKERSKLAKILTTKIWYLGTLFGVRRKIDNRWIEYRQPIDLLDQPPNLKIGLYHYQIKNESMWTHDLTNCLMIKLETIIALTIVTYVVEANLHELHPMDERVFDGCIDDK